MNYYRQTGAILMRTFFLLITLTLCLPGCINNQGITSAEGIQSRDWARVSKEDAAEEKPLYCYRTLGQVNCYAQPVPGRHKQLVTEHPPIAPDTQDQYDEEVIRIKKFVPTDHHLMDHDHDHHHDDHDGAPTHIH